jgi:hypothetical protein
MKKSENASKIWASFTQESEPSGTQSMLPFSGLGFDLRPVLTRRVRVRMIGIGVALFVAHCEFDSVLPSGRWLQLRLGQEIRGR